MAQQFYQELRQLRLQIGTAGFMGCEVQELTNTTIQIEVNIKAKKWLEEKLATALISNGLSL